MLSDKARSPELMERPYLRNENIRWWHIDFASVKTMGFKHSELRDAIPFRSGRSSGSRDKVGSQGDVLSIAGFLTNSCTRRRSIESAQGLTAAPVVACGFGSREISGDQPWRLEPSAQDKPAFPLARFSDIELPVPPRREQQRIVAAIEQHLSDIDAGVAALQRALANLKRYRAAVLKAACEGKLVPTEAELARKAKRDYEPADVLLKRILEERRSRWEADQLAKMNGQLLMPYAEQGGGRRRYKQPVRLGRPRRRAGFGPPWCQLFSCGTSKLAGT